MPIIPLKLVGISIIFGDNINITFCENSQDATKFLTQKNAC